MNQTTLTSPVKPPAAPLHPLEDVIHKSEPITNSIPISEFIPTKLPFPGEPKYISLHKDLSLAYDSTRHARVRGKVQAIITLYKGTPDEKEIGYLRRFKPYNKPYEYRLITHRYFADCNHFNTDINGYVIEMCLVNSLVESGWGDILCEVHEHGQNRDTGHMKPWVFPVRRWEEGEHVQKSMLTDQKGLSIDALTRFTKENKGR
jgi:hypothetical protein